MLICFASDLHGDTALYEQLEELLRAATPDLLILGGDLLPDGDRHDPLGTQVAWLESRFIPMLQGWRDAQPRLAIACLPGNHEWSCARDALRRHHAAGRVALLDHRHVWQHAGVNFLGFTYTPPTPHWLKDFERLDVAGDGVPDFPGVIWNGQAVHEVEPQRYFRERAALEEELSQVPPIPEPWIFVAHAPPHGTALDRLEKLPQPIGSRAVRRFIEQRQPFLSLHGHVHESPRVSGACCDRIGRTLCVNPGQDHERLHAVLLESERPEQTLRHVVWP